MTLFNNFFHSILPQPCSCCGLTTNDSSLSLCEYCHYALPWLGHACSLCALPLADQSATTCGQCLQHPPAFSEAKIPFRYDYPLDQMILSFKFQHQFARGNTLSQLLIDFLHDAYKGLQMPDALLPVPMYRWRQFQRGFNQSQLLAHDIAKAFSITELKHTCIRNRQQQSQKDSNKNTRRTNLKNAFQLNTEKQFMIQGKHLALIDDVVTTGATVRELSNLLIKQGAASVVIWALARTPGPNSP